MDRFDIRKFEEYRENNRLEIKKAKNGLPESLWDTYSAMANCHGGMILLGMAEKNDGSFSTTGLKNVLKLQKDFWNTINNRKKVSINLLTDDDVESYTIGEDVVLAIHVPRAHREYKPVYINNDLFSGTFRRNGEGDYHCTKGEVKGMLRDQIEETADMKLLEDFEISDLNMETVHAYRNRHTAYRAEHVWEGLTDEEYLERIGAAKRTKSDKKLHPTAAGLLMFGEEYRILYEYPEYFLDYREMLDPTIRWTDRVQSGSGDWSGNLFDFFFRVYFKLVKDLKIPFKLDGMIRIDDTPVHKALREALANCLVNTDFFVERGIVIKKDSDKIIMENPGYIRTGRTQMLKGGISDPRNKALMKMFNLIGIGERAGSGVPDIYAVWEAQGWIEPLVEEQYNPDRTILTLSFTKKQAQKTSTKNKYKNQAEKASRNGQASKTLKNKEFNTTGICIPSLHYMADTTDIINQIIDDYIEPGEYFTINRARQFGKTTTLELLYHKLKEKYIVIDISFEAADEYFQSLGSLARGLIMDISERLEVQEVPDALRKAWASPISEEFPLRDFGKKITALCSNSDREVILTIDEIDKNADNQIFLSFLGLLREKYLKQKSGRDHTFKSVILAGVYDIKNLKLKLHAPGEPKYNSPWNIAADFNINMNLTEAGIAGMLRDYEEDHHTGMDIEYLSRQLFDYTSGYPYLVSRLCKIIDEKAAGTKEYPDKSSAWTKAGFQTAVKQILYESNTLFDDMMKKLNEYPELSKMIYAVLFTGKSISYSPDNQAMDIGIRFGFIKSADEQIVVSNRIFETRLYNYYLAEDMLENRTYSASMQIKNQFIHGNRLDMELILKKFVEHFTDIYADSPDRFVEENGRRLFLLYLKPIINGIGNYYIESRTRSMGRTDVVVDYLGQQYIIEMKIYRGNEYNLRGEKQLMGYLNDYHLQKGYMLSFSFHKKKRIGVHEIHVGDKILIEAIV